MYIETVDLLNYRNFNELNVKLNKDINIFYGNNAHGKTNFLEAIYLSATGRSHRSINDKELINFDHKEAFIKTTVKNNYTTNIIEIHLKNTNKKGIAIDHIPIKKVGDLFGLILVVIFSPEDLNMIKKGPAERRRFMDIDLCQLNKVYFFNLNQYYNVLKQRNSLLKNLQKNRKSIDTLEIWDIQLYEYAKKIMIERYAFINSLNEFASPIYKDISGNLENLKIEYKPNVDINEFLQKLKKNYEKDIIFGATSSGIHKDDISFIINNFDVRTFASQGQQRSVALASKLAEIQIIKKEKLETPILLLDDVLSELDINRQNYLLENIQNTQTILTCTNIDKISSGSKNNFNIFYVEKGLITLKSG